MNDWDGIQITMYETVTTVDLSRRVNELLLIMLSAELPAGINNELFVGRIG